MTLLCGQSSNLHGKSTRDFINVTLQTDNIQDVSGQRSNRPKTFGWKVMF